MKATKLLLLVLSCMLVIGCKKNSDEPTPPSQQTDTISAELLKSYFPYTNMEKIEFIGGGGMADIVTYTINEAKLSFKNNQMLFTTNMAGKAFGESSYHFYTSMNAEVTNGTVLKVDFSYIDGIRSPLKASYTHNITKDGELPETLEFSSGDITVKIKKDKGLIYFKEMQTHWEWQFRRIVE